MNKKQAVLKLLDEYSHEENPEHALKFPDINEIDNCVNLILELLEKKDQEHYNALIQSLNE
ncbi:MAG: hypothetical protein NZ927_09885, partial [Candidatus Calescibacterium sp.]|nr:hypothetical protein [Candidatus Calescibacterium sp.]